MAKTPSDDDSYDPEEARRRFEQAVDKALRTPPKHREANLPPTVKPKAKKSKAKRLGKN